MHVHIYDIVVARTSETALGVCYDACFSQINLAFGMYSTYFTAIICTYVYMYKE